LWAIGNDLPCVTNFPSKVVRPDSTQSYSSDSASDTSNNTDYFDTWSENDSGYDSDPFIALLLLTFYQGILNHWTLIRRIIIRRMIFKGLIICVLGCFGYLPSWWDINSFYSFYSSLSFWWDSVSIILNLTQLNTLIKWWIEH